MNTEKVEFMNFKSFAGTMNTEKGGESMDFKSFAAVLEETAEEVRIARQKSEWNAMRNRIGRLVESIRVSTVRVVADRIMKFNLHIGRGVLCQAIMKSQSKFPELSDVYASLVAVINSVFPDLGQLLVKRTVLQFRKAFDCRDAKKLQNTSKFIACLMNQAVVNEYLALDILLILLADPSSDNVEIAVKLCFQCGSLLMKIMPYELKGIFAEFGGVLKKGSVKKRVQVMIVKLFAAKKNKFEKHIRVVDELNLVKGEDQVTHCVSLLDDIDPEREADFFKPNSSPDETCNLFKSKYIQ